MNHIYKKYFLTLICGFATMTPVLASNGKGIVEGIAIFLLIAALSTFVILLIPIITMIIGITKNNQKLIGFSKVYAFVTVTLSFISLVYNNFELLGLHFICICAAALPLIILGLSGKQNA